MGSLQSLFDLMLFGLASIVLFGGWVCSIYYALCVKWTWIQRDAELIRYWVKHRDADGPDGKGKGQAFYYPVVQYRGPNGKKRIGFSSLGYGWPTMPIGSRVQIFCHPTDTRRIELGGFCSLWLLPLILLVLLMITAFIFVFPVWIASLSG